MQLVISSGVTSMTVTVDDDNCDSVARVFELYRGLLNIPENVSAQVNGEDASFDTPVSEGDEVAFNPRTGSKG